MKGRFLANIFIHFEPVAPLSDPNPIFQADFPPYIIPGSPEDSHWRQQNPSGWNAVQTFALTDGTTEAHQAVIHGSAQQLANILDMHPSYANAQDELDWTPLHEAVRARRLDMVQMLIERGADMNAVTKGGESVLGLAYWFLQNEDPKYVLPDRQPVIEYLNGLGALYMMPQHEEL